MAYQYIRPYIEYPIEGAATTDDGLWYIFSFPFRVTNNNPSDNAPGSTEVAFQLFDSGGAQVTGKVDRRVILLESSLLPDSGTIGTYTGDLQLLKADVDRLRPMHIALFRETDKSWEATPRNINQTDFEALRAGIEKLFRRVADVEEIFVDEEGDISRGETNPLLHENRFNLPTYPHYQMYSRATREPGTFEQLAANQWILEPEILSGTRNSDAPEHATLNLALLRHDPDNNAPAFAGGPIRPDRPYDVRFRGTINFVWTEALSGYLEGHLQIIHHFPMLSTGLRGVSRVREIPFRTQTYPRAANGASTSNPFGGSTNYQAIPLSIFNSEFVFRQSDADGADWWPYRNSTPTVEIRLITNALRTTVRSGVASQIYIGQPPNSDRTFGINITDLSLDEASVTFTQLRGIEGDAEDNVRLGTTVDTGGEYTDLELFLNETLVSTARINAPNLEGLRGALALHVDTSTPGQAVLGLRVDNQPAGVDRTIELGDPGTGGGTFVSGMEFNTSTSELRLLLSVGDPITVHIPIVTALEYDASNKQLTVRSGDRSSSVSLNSLASTSDVSTVADGLRGDILRVVDGVRLTHVFHVSDGEIETIRTVPGGGTHRDRVAIQFPRRVQSVGLGLSSGNIVVDYSDGTDNEISIPHITNARVVGQNLIISRHGVADIQVTLPSGGGGGGTGPGDGVVTAANYNMSTGALTLSLSNSTIVTVNLPIINAVNTGVVGGTDTLFLSRPGDTDGSGGTADTRLQVPILSQAILRRHIAGRSASQTDGLRLRASVSGSILTIAMAWEGDLFQQQQVTLPTGGGGGGGTGPGATYSYYDYDPSTGSLLLRTSTTRPGPEHNALQLPLAGTELVGGTAALQGTKHSLADMEVQGGARWRTFRTVLEAGVAYADTANFLFPSSSTPLGSPHVPDLTYSDAATVPEKTGTDSSIYVIVRLRNDQDPNDFRIAVDGAGPSGVRSYVYVSEMVDFLDSSDHHNYYISRTDIINSPRGVDREEGIPWVVGESLTLSVLKKAEETFGGHGRSLTRYKGQLDSNVGQALIDLNDLTLTARTSYSGMVMSLGIQGETNDQRTASVDFTRGNVHFIGHDEGLHTLEHQVFPNQHYSSPRARISAAVFGGFATELLPTGRPQPRTDDQSVVLPVRKMIFYISRPSRRSDARGGDRTTIQNYRVDTLNPTRGQDIPTDPENRVRSWSDADGSVMETSNAELDFSFGREYRYGYGALEAYPAQLSQRYAPESDNCRFFAITRIPGQAFWNTSVTQTLGQDSRTIAPPEQNVFRNNWFFAVTGGEEPQDTFGENTQADITISPDAARTQVFDPIAYRKQTRVPTSQSYYSFINVVDLHDTRITSQGTRFYEQRAEPLVDIRTWRSTGVNDYRHAISAWVSNTRPDLTAEGGTSVDPRGIGVLDAFLHTEVSYDNDDPTQAVTEIQDKISVRYMLLFDFDQESRLFQNNLLGDPAPFSVDRATTTRRWPGEGATAEVGSRRGIGVSDDFQHVSRDDRLFIAPLKFDTTHAPIAHRPHLLLRNSRPPLASSEARMGNGLTTDANFQQDSSQEIRSDAILVDVTDFRGPLRTSAGPAIVLSQIPNANLLAQGQLFHGLAEGFEPASVLAIYEGTNRRLQVSSIILDSAAVSGASYETLFTNAAHWEPEGLSHRYHGEIATITFPAHSIEGFFKFHETIDNSDTQYIISEKAGNHTYFHLIRFQGLGDGAQFNHQILTEEQYTALGNKRNDTLYFTTED